MNVERFDSSFSTAFAWDGELRLAWAPFDALHEEFVSLVRAVLNAPDEGVGAALRAVRVHTVRQFAIEERWMHEAGFPTFGFHADEHGAVLASMSCVSRKTAAGDSNAARVYARALMEWFAGHARDLDCALARWISTKSLHGELVCERSRDRLHGMEQVPAPALSAFPSKDACSARVRVHARTTYAAPTIISQSAMRPKSFMHLTPVSESIGAVS